MGASLTQMIVAIVLSGILIAGAVTPTAAVLVTYQKLQGASQTAGTHAGAAVRFEQVVGSIWRDATPPGGHGALNSATATELSAAGWDVRRSSTRIEHERSGVTGVLAGNVGSFTLEYLLQEGEWTSSSLDSSERDELVAVRVSWTDTASGEHYSARALLPDRAFGAGALGLPTPSTTTAYARSDYERTVALSIAGW